jgi:hypothetical protein
VRVDAAGSGVDMFNILGAIAIILVSLAKVATMVGEN